MAARIPNSLNIERSRQLKVASLDTVAGISTMPPVQRPNRASGVGSLSTLASGLTSKFSTILRISSSSRSVGVSNDLAASEDMANTLSEQALFKDLIRMRVTDPKEAAVQFGSLLRSQVFNVVPDINGVASKGYSFKEFCRTQHMPRRVVLPYTVHFDSRKRPYVMSNLGPGFTVGQKSEGARKAVRFVYDVHAGRFVVMKKPIPIKGVIPLKTTEAFEKEHRIATRLNRYSELAFFGDKGSYLISEAMDGDAMHFFDSLQGMETKEVKKSVFKFIYLLAEDLQKLHDSGVIHGDLKFENILVSGKTSNELVVQVDDFDLSHELDPGETAKEKSSLSGTFQILAPELVPASRHESVLYSPQSDIFAFGVVLLDLFCNTEPFFVQESKSASVNKLAGYRRESRQIGARKVAVGAQVPKFTNTEICSEVESGFGQGIFRSGLFSFQEATALKDVIKGCLLEAPNQRLPLSDIIDRLHDLIE